MYCMITKNRILAAVAVCAALAIGVVEDGRLRENE